MVFVVCYLQLSTQANRWDAVKSTRTDTGTGTDIHKSTPTRNTDKDAIQTKIHADTHVCAATPRNIKEKRARGYEHLHKRIHPSHYLK